MEGDAKSVLLQFFGRWTATCKFSSCKSQDGVIVLHVALDSDIGVLLQNWSGLNITCLLDPFKQNLDARCC